MLPEGSPLPPLIVTSLRLTVSDDASSSYFHRAQGLCNAGSHRDPALCHGSVSSSQRCHSYAAVALGAGAAHIALGKTKRRPRVNVAVSRGEESWLRGPAKPAAEAVEQFLPDLIVAEMERMNGHKAVGQGFAGFMEQAQVASCRLEVNDQRRYGARLLRRVLPPQATGIVKGFLAILEKHWPDAHVFMVKCGTSLIGVPLAHWLVGDCRLVEDDEYHEMTASSAVKLPKADGGMLLVRKCKFLEESGGCKGLCLNMCKAGTEEYLATEMGISAYLEPNFEDQSCRIHLLTSPSPIRPEEDPVFAMPCASKTCDNRFEMPTACGLCSAGCNSEPESEKRC